MIHHSQNHTKDPLRSRLTRPRIKNHVPHVYSGFHIYGNGAAGSCGFWVWLPSLNGPRTFSTLLLAALY